MKLKKLIRHLPVKVIGKQDLEILGVFSHSKTVVVGSLFIAKMGLTHKGSDYIQEAIDAGAIAIVTDVFNPFYSKITQIICSDPKSVEGVIADRFYRHPSEKMFMIGLVGTNGKTTTSYLIRQILGEKQCGLIGTIEYVLGDHVMPASLTTPDVISNHKMLSSMVAKKVKAAVMEVTSIAIDQNRVDHINFDLLVYTNLTQDHLDYHGTMQNYIEAKAKIFKNLPAKKTALINIDCPISAQIIKDCSAKIKTYGINKTADYQAREVKLMPHGTTFNLHIKNKSWPVFIPLIGLYNVYNALAAIAAGCEAKKKIKNILEVANQFSFPKGRLERVDNELGVQIFVDFAHTDDALTNVLKTLKEIEHKKIITVFGCGGDRDPTKRPLMGKAVTLLSDLAIVTSDNPRSEDPEKICQQILKGCDVKCQTYLEVDRRKAIRLALELAEAQDIILIAGRGHEKHQLIGRKSIEFEDAAVVKEQLEQIKLLQLS